MSKNYRRLDLGPLLQLIGLASTAGYEPTLEAPVNLTTQDLTLSNRSDLPTNSAASSLTLINPESKNLNVRYQQPSGWQNFWSGGQLGRQTRGMNQQLLMESLRQGDDLARQKALADYQQQLKDRETQQNRQELNQQITGLNMPAKLNPFPNPIYYKDQVFWPGEVQAKNTLGNLQAAQNIAKLPGASSEALAQQQEATSKAQLGDVLSKQDFNTYFSDPRLRQTELYGAANKIMLGNRSTELENQAKEITNPLLGRQTEANIKGKELSNIGQEYENQIPGRIIPGIGFIINSPQGPQLLGNLPPSPAKSLDFYKDEKGNWQAGPKAATPGTLTPPKLIPAPSTSIVPPQVKTPQSPNAAPLNAANSTAAQEFINFSDNWKKQNPITPDEVNDPSIRTKRLIDAWNASRK